MMNWLYHKRDFGQATRPKVLPFTSSTFVLVDVFDNGNVLRIID